MEIEVMELAKVDVLLEGFVDESQLTESKIARYRPTVSLIRAGGLVIIVDPGTTEKQEEIVDALASCGTRPSEVTHVIHTHHHLDHTRNSGMFPDIPVIDDWATWSGVNFHTTPPMLPVAVRVVKTPGHTYDSITVYVDTPEGLVAICGDVLWWEGDTASDVYAEDTDSLGQSRAQVLSHADFVIPGHGPRFKVAR